MCNQHYYLKVQSMYKSVLDYTQVEFADHHR